VASASRPEAGGEGREVVTAERLAPGVSRSLLPTDTPAEVRISLGHWRDADQDNTYLIVTHRRRPLPEERARYGRLADRIPAETEQLRQRWVAAHEAQDGAEPALRDQLDAALAAAGWFKDKDVSAWDPARTVELSPGVLVQDERPSHPHSK